MTPPRSPHAPEEWIATRALLLLACAGLAGCVGDAADAAPVQTDVVRIPGPWIFEPAAIEIVNGTTVTFVNDGGADHTVTSDAFDFDVVVPPGGETMWTFDAPGRFEYVCKYHPPDMRGVVLVVEHASSAS